jgi:hypothetical protein
MRGERLRLHRTLTAHTGVCRKAMAHVRWGGPVRVIIVLLMIISNQQPEPDGKDAK